jgi:quinol monooxygenase YgiN
MYLYQIKIQLVPDKVDEFVKNLRSVWFEFLKEDGCINYHVYRELEKKDSFCLIGEFDTQDSMMNHFRTGNYGILIGASNILGKNLKINLSTVSQTGGLDLAKSLIRQGQ